MIIEQNLRIVAELDLLKYFSAVESHSYESLAKEISSLVFKITSNANVLERSSRKLGGKEDNSDLRNRM